MKRKLLMTFDGRRYGETFRPVLLSLKDDFDIWILGYDISTPAYARQELDQWVKEGLIKWYEFCPYPPYSKVSLWHKHVFISQMVDKLKDVDFEVWLTTGEMQILERYIKDCLLKSSCLTIALWPGLTYLFEHEALVYELLGKSERGRQLLKAFRKPKNNETTTMRRIIKQCRQILGWIKRCPVYLKKSIMVNLDRVVFPFLLKGKMFLFGPHDRTTQLGSGRLDAYLFTDESEVIAHQTLFGRGKFFVVKLPVFEHGEKEKVRKAVLSPSSIFIGQKSIAPKYLESLLRDYRLALSKIGADEIDLRLHPDENTLWYQVVADYLNANGVKMNIVGCDRPIREVIGKYMGMVGLSSCALRDARIVNEKLTVIGFEAGSKFRFEDPIFVYGLSEGIDWILEDGSMRVLDESISSNQVAKQSVKDVIQFLLNSKT